MHADHDYFRGRRRRGAQAPGKQRGLKFKTLLNHALRESIKSLMGPTKKRSVFRTRSVNLGSCRAGNVDNLAEVLAVAEGELFK
jgi:hypothetical protein